MTITAKIVADTVGPLYGTRITTMLLRYPRFIHAEFMTHRMFSRNASSSRAIPVKRLIEDVMIDPAMPLFWGKNQPGMQAYEEHNAKVYMTGPTGEAEGLRREEAWRWGLEHAISLAKAYEEAGYHKQIVNRLLEPWAHINVVVTATEWDNFFALRTHKTAQPEIQVLAKAMQAALEESTPIRSGWHIPFCKRGEYPWMENSLLSAARCARTSYLTHDMKEPDYEADMKLARRLMEPEDSGPPHMSPFEHAAVESEGKYANYTNWQSKRHLLEMARTGKGLPQI